MDRREKLNNAVDSMADAANIMGNEKESVEAFMDALRCTHRTLQQGIIGLMIGVLEQYADLDDRWIDARNECARAACRKLKPIIEADCMAHMPLI